MVSDLVPIDPYEPWMGKGGSFGGKGGVLVWNSFLLLRVFEKLATRGFGVEKKFAVHQFHISFFQLINCCASEFFCGVNKSLFCLPGYYAQLLIVCRITFAPA